MPDETEHSRDDKHRILRDWVELQRTVLPLDTAIDQVRSRLEKAIADETDTLQRDLYAMLTEAHRPDEALQLLDTAIAQRPNEVLSPDGGWPYDDHDDPNERLRLIDFALVRARRTGTWVRSILGSKAWYLAGLRRGEDLAQVLEQIMAHKVRRDVADVGRERYFVDASPPGLIPADIRARYDVFCPKREHDVPFPPPHIEAPEWGPDGDETIATRPRADAIDRSWAGAPGGGTPETPTAAPVEEIDRIIFPRLPTHGTWRKTAAVIGWVSRHYEDQQLTIDDNEVFERVLQLVIDGRPESQGNLSLWRYSEVRPVQTR